MGKLIPLNDAAKRLGVTNEQLVEMIGRKEIFGYRDGPTWKFKPDEVERVRHEREAAAAGTEEDIDSDSILVTDQPEGQPEGEGGASTIIGATETPDVEADIELAGSAGDQSAGSAGSELRLVGSGVSRDEGVSDVQLAGPSSDLHAPESDLQLVGSDLGSKKSGDTGNLSGQADQQSSSFELSLEEDVSLEESGSLKLEGEEKSPGGSSGFESAIELDLGDEDLVIGSATGSDITAGTGDSGINLANPSDSGLSLEEPLELGAGSAAEALELGEDDLISVDAAGAARPGEADFNLTPVEGVSEEADSGSQVIAIDSDEFDHSAATLLDESGQQVLEEEVEFETVEEPAGMAAAGIAGAPLELEETYSVWNVVSLICIFVLLGLGTIMMLDVILHIWSWDGPYAFNSKLMDGIAGMLGFLE